MGTIGRVDLCVMGARAAGHPIGGGHVARRRSRNGVPEAPGGREGRVCDTPRLAAEQAEAVVATAPDAPGAASAPARVAGAAGGLTAGVRLIDMSPISPPDARDFAPKIGAMVRAPELPAGHGVGRD